MPNIDKVRLVMTQLPPFAEFHFCKVHQGNALHNSQDNVSDTKPHPSPPLMPPFMTMWCHVPFCRPWRNPQCHPCVQWVAIQRHFSLRSCSHSPAGHHQKRCIRLVICVPHGQWKPSNIPWNEGLGSLDWIRDTSVERWGQGFTNLNFIGIRYKLLRTYKWEFRGNMSSLHQINIGTLSLKKG